MTKLDHGRSAAEKLYAFAFEKARRIVADGEEHVPLLLIAYDDDKLDIVGVPGMPKQLLAQLHVSLAMKPGVKVALLVMEGWMYQGKDRRIIAAIERGDLRVADLPEKGESLVFSARVGARQFLALCPIDRAAKTTMKKRLLEPGVDEGVYGGRFVGSGVNVN